MTEKQNGHQNFNRKSLPRSAELRVCISICTKDREAQLYECLKHLLESVRVASENQNGHGVSFEILIVDDGHLSVNFERHCSQAVSNSLTEIKIIRKDSLPGTKKGLYASRRMSVSITKADVILFIDDDCNLGPSYIDGLLSHFVDPYTVAVGGVDHRNVPRTVEAWKTFIFEKFLLCGNASGNLSPTGFNYGHHHWRNQREPFFCDWLHGCNMAYRTNVIRSMPVHGWLQGHAACEDLVISNLAADSGKVLIDPNLDFQHLELPGGRGASITRLKRKILGHWNFQISRDASVRSKLLFCWSLLGFFIYSTLKATRQVSTNSKQKS